MKEALCFHVNNRLSYVNANVCFTLSNFFLPPTDAQFDSPTNNFKFALKLTLKAS